MEGSTGRAALGGTWFVLPTPFGPDGTLDLESQRRVVEAAIEWGVDGLTAMGVTSEAAALAPDERSAALGAIADSIGGRVPLVVGCSGGSVEGVAGLAGEASAVGAMAVMVAAPPLARDVDALPDFYARVARAVTVPLVVQDEPAATGVVMPVSVLIRILDAPGCGTVKLEDPPTPPKIARLLEARPDLEVFGGLGGVSALYELRAGACGTMTGFAFPEVLKALREAHESGDHDRASSVFDRHLPLIQFEAQPGVGLSIRKELLRRRGVIRTAVTRIGRPVDARTERDLDDVLARVRIDPRSGPLRVADAATRGEELPSFGG